MDEQRYQISGRLAVFDGFLIEQGFSTWLAMTKVILHTEDWKWV
jgi:hypothetical protein